ncbi:unnamed protein product [Rotaria socialis]|nr:unnamed protein product [Rotaria socialis]
MAVVDIDNKSEPTSENNPPPYQNPQLDFNGGWKDLGFTIVFGIHIIVVIVVGLVLGIPIVIPYIKQVSSEKPLLLSPDFDVKPFVYSLSGAAAVGGLLSFLTIFALQLCAGHFIKCSFFMLIIMYSLTTVTLFFVEPLLCIIPGLLILFMLIYISCTRKRIAFAEAHLQAGCASLRSRPSLVLIALIVLIIEFMWFIFWCLMVVGVIRALNIDLTTNKVSMTNNPTESATIYGLNAKTTPITLSYWMREETKAPRMNSYSMDEQSQYMNTSPNSLSNPEQENSGFIYKIVVFFLLLSWYWGAITFGNIINFVTACTVGDWWFSNDDCRLYGMSNSIKRAFTTNLGTICFGSLFQAIIKTLRFFTGDGRRKNIIVCIIDCILLIIEKLIGYLNDWAFTFAALTGEGFVQASRSFIKLFEKRGWTAIINDSIIGTTLMFINIGIGLISAVAGGSFIYLTMVQSSKPFFAIICISSISFLIGLFISSIFTTLLASCVRTVFVCFALHPAALGATHPEHLEKLTTAWHKFYPEEFASSGYANQFKEPPVYSQC